MKEFNDAFLSLGNGLPHYPDGEYFQLIRSSLPDDCGIRLTHTDLAASNIIISPTSAKVVGIIDWQESGWYPEYWEVLKAKYNADGRWLGSLERHFGLAYSREWDGFSTLVCTGIF